MTSRPPRALALALASAILLGGCTADPGPDAGGPGPAPAWESLPPMPTPRTEVAAAVADGTIVVAGGFDAEGATVATVEIYDVEAGAWSSGPDLPVAVNHAMAASTGDHVVVFGGYDAAGDPVHDVSVLADGAWMEATPMPEARAAGGAAPAAGRIWIAGGIGPARGELAARTLVYDPVDDTWSAGGGLGSPREHLGVAGLGDGVYAAAGRVGGLEGNLDAFERYDVASGAWEVLPGLPTARGGSAAAAGSGLVVVAGGEAPEGTFPEVEAYSVDGRSWQGLPDLITPRHGLGLVVLDDVLYAVGGGPEPGLTVSGALEALDLRTL